MKARTNIFSLSFMLILAVLHVQPLFLQYGGTKQQSCTQVVKPVCSKSKCSQSEPAEEKKGCTNQGCNPFVPCSIGMCCYLVENVFSYSVITIGPRQKIALVNDNRLQKNLSECWHPPELFS